MHTLQQAADPGSALGRDQGAQSHTRMPTLDAHAAEEGSAFAQSRTVALSGAYSVASLLSVEDILLDVAASTRDQVFATFAERIAPRRGLSERDIVAGLAEREELGSTALGQGVALPHARLKGLRLPIAAFVRPQCAIAFDAPDGKLVSSLLFLLVPDGATDAHLELLAQAAGMFCDKAFRDRLSCCVGPAEIMAEFARWPSA